MGQREKWGGKPQKLWIILKKFISWRFSNALQKALHCILLKCYPVICFDESYCYLLSLLQAVGARRQEASPNLSPCPNLKVTLSRMRAWKEGYEVEKGSQAGRGSLEKSTGHMLLPSHVSSWVTCANLRGGLFDMKHVVEIWTVKFRLWCGQSFCKVSGHLCCL